VGEDHLCCEELLILGITSKGEFMIQRIAVLGQLSVAVVMEEHCRFRVLKKTVFWSHSRSVHKRLRVILVGFGLTWPPGAVMNADACCIGDFAFASLLRGPAYRNTVMLGAQTPRQRVNKWKYTNPMPARHLPLGYI